MGKNQLREYITPNAKNTLTIKRKRHKTLKIKQISF